jgi:hypothetical protein
MPRRNALNSFGPEFEQLLLQATNALRKGQQEYAVEFSSQKACHSVKFRMYAYMKALRESADRPDLTALQTNLSLRAVSCSLYFYRSGDDLDAKAIREALNLPDGFADGPSSAGVVNPESPLSENLERLRNIRAGSKN